MSRIAMAAVIALVVALFGTAPPSEAATLGTGSDSFSRVVTGGLGSADSGGAWTISGTTSRYSVAAGVASVSTPAGAQYSAYLGSTSLRDTDLVATVGLSSVPKGGPLYAGVLARRTASTEYTGRVVIDSAGAVRVSLLAGAVSLQSVAVPGLTAGPASSVRIRLQTIGANPTTVRARAWRTGSAEPATWQATVTDSTPGLQAAGSIGIRSYLSSSATNGPVVATFDDLVGAAPVVPNAPPAAAFAATANGLTVAFDASASSDPDGSIVDAAWDFGDGATATGTASTHTYATSGTYTATLTVRDDRGATGTATRPVTVVAPPPVLHAAFSIGANGRTITVDASGSTGAVAYAWDFGDGSTGDGVTASHTYAADGTVAVTLTVTDAAGLTDTTSQDTVVSAPNRAPIAAFTSAVSGLGVTVDGSTSSDPDGTVAVWAWTFGDGATATGASATHAYAQPGTYTVTLTVTDDGGAVASTQSQQTVARPNRLPEAVLLEEQTALAASFWGDRSVDPDGAIVAYSWSFGDNTTAMTASTSHTYAAPGTYPVVLTVTDNTGAQSSVSRSVTVFAAGIRPTQAQWLTDAGNTLAGGADYLDAHRTDVRPAIVLDIDNTSLQSTYQPFVATPVVLAFAQRAMADGYTILVATGRTADTGGTMNQLTRAVYRVDALCFRNPTAPSVQASKTACRAAWAQTYTIVGNVGNHTTDLLGGSSGRQYLLPNYGFLD